MVRRDEPGSNLPSVDGIPKKLVVPANRETLCDAIRKGVILKKVVKPATTQGANSQNAGQPGWFRHKPTSLRTRFYSRSNWAVLGEYISCIAGTDLMSVMSASPMLAPKAGQFLKDNLADRRSRVERPQSEYDDDEDESNFDHWSWFIDINQYFPICRFLLVYLYKYPYHVWSFKIKIAPICHSHGHVTIKVTLAAHALALALALPLALEYFKWAVAARAYSISSRKYKRHYVRPVNLHRHARG